MIKRTLLILIIVAFTMSAGAIAVYYINPYDLKTDNIRPRIFGFDIYRIPSKSMQPLLSPDDYIMVSNLAYIEKSPLRKDVIVFNQKKKTHLKKIQHIKRIVAIGGDTVELQNGELFVNKKLVNEDYVLPSNNKTPYSLKMPETTIPTNHVFVMGDNRDNSADSRLYGAISQKEIVAKANVILYGVNDRSGNEIK